MNATTVGSKMFPPLATVLLCVQLANMDKGHISPLHVLLNSVYIFSMALSIYNQSNYNEKNQMVFYYPRPGVTSLQLKKAILQKPMT